ncbi:MAG: DNA polymerase I [Myxococcota bacterium]|nr:DNA polymerase I [Myxococcota bacterium]
MNPNTSPEPRRPTICLVDGSSYIFRAYFGNRRPMSADGVPTNAVYAFATMMLKLMREKNPDYIAVAFDTKHPGFRRDIYPEYKSHRPPPPEDLIPQFDLIHQLCDAINSHRLMCDAWEADDIIATLAREARENGMDVVVVSSDKDLMQLLRPGVRMIDSMKDAEITLDTVREKFGVPPELVPDVQALCGDASDNVPGVPGIGEKTAGALVSEYGGLEGVLANAAKVKSAKVRENLITHADTARLSLRLVRLDDHVPGLPPLESLKSAPVNTEKARELFTRLKFNSLMRNLGIAPEEAPAAAEKPACGPAGQEDLFAPPADETPAPAAAVQANPGFDSSQYRIIRTRAELDQLAAELERFPVFAFDLETDSLDTLTAGIAGISLCAVPGQAVYIPTGHRGEGAGTQLPLELVLEKLRPLLHGPDRRPAGHNCKYDVAVLARHGVAVPRIGGDTMLAAHLLDPDQRSFKLEAVVSRRLGLSMIPYEEVTRGAGGKPVNFMDVPVDKAARYSAEDADAALRLHQIFEPELKAFGAWKLYEEIECPLVNVLMRMESAGVLVDVDQLRQLGRHLESEITRLIGEVHELAGGEFNVNSPKQLAQVLFDKLGYPVIKKNKSGPSTDQEVLETLAERGYPLPAKMLEHRMVQKLKSTYVDALPEMIHPLTGRIHSSFNQTGAATGRLSSVDPNLQNIPVRGKLGKEIRRAFVAPPGRVLISADYSQIELRVLAHLSGDQAMLAAFEAGEDIHSRTAAEVFSAAAGEITPEMRRAAKAINFGIVYGLSAFGLARDLKIPRGEAARYIETYFSRYAGVRAYMDNVIEQARQRGYVETMMGRRRPLPDLASRNPAMRSQAERIALNSPIQGTAAEIIKAAMIRVDQALPRFGGARLILQVHDEIVIECGREEAEEVRDMIVKEMSGALKLRVPLLAGAHIGANWAEIH